MEITASNFSKQRPLMIPTRPIRTVELEVHVLHIHNFIKLIDWLA